MPLKSLEKVLLRSLAVGATAALLAPAIMPAVVGAMGEKTPQAQAASGAPGLTNRGITIAQQTVLQVDPQSGNLRTITAALQQARPGTVIALAPGTYGAGETFPLQLKPGVTLKGNDSQQGAGVVITGGGQHVSRTFARQNVTIVLSDDSQISGITVTNPNTRGTGIWVEDVTATISNSTLINNNREGIFVAGRAAATIESNKFMNNAANGVSVAGEAAGEIRNNVFEQTGFGLAVGGKATTAVTNNQIRGNRSGIVITNSARPMVQGNTIENNRDYGVVALDRAMPGMGNNTFRGNGQQDSLLVNGSSGMQTAVAPSPPTPVQPNSQGAKFSCIQMGNGYATVAEKGSTAIPQPMIMWTRTNLGPELTPERRCQIVTERLNRLLANNGGNMDNLLFTIGTVSNQMVVCLVRDRASGCQPDNLLFTLSQQNASNAAEVLKSLIAFSVTGEGAPVFESEDDDGGGQPYAALSEVSDRLQTETGLWFAAP